MWKTSYSFRFFTSSYIRRNLIFHISFCFVNVIVRDAGSHATGLFCLWSAWPQLIVNGEQMKEIFINFMGIQAGPKPFLMPPFTVNVYWILSVYCVLQYLYTVSFILFSVDPVEDLSCSFLSSSLPFLPYFFFYLECPPFSCFYLTEQAAGGGEEHHSCWVPEPTAVRRVKKGGKKDRKI